MRPIVTPSAPAISADTMATASDTRAPHSRRASTSRPYSSWPRGCAGDGCVSRCATSMRTGSCDVSRGASSATRHMAATPATGSSNRRRLLMGPLDLDGPWPSTVSAHARVEYRVEQVDREVEGHEDHADDEHDALDLRIVALLHRAHEKAGQPRPVEDVLDEHGAAEQAEHGDDGTERVAHDVAAQHLARREALGVRGAHPVPRQRVEHRRAH